MKGVAFCPAHITGFFGISIGDSPERTGSVGAGFSIERGVTTSVDTTEKGDRPGLLAGHVLDEFAEKTGIRQDCIGITHDIGIPVGYGLGASGALALSTAYALDAACGTGLDRLQLAQMAHRAEVHNRTGLGDVLASYHGGFEARTVPGGPGYGRLQGIPIGDVSVILVCLSPLLTRTYWEGDMKSLNGTGNTMTRKLLEAPAPGYFQEMSLQFARRNGIITPKIERIAKILESVGAGCGMAMLGETAFALVPPEDEDGVLEALDGYPLIKSRIDTCGARVL